MPNMTMRTKTAVTIAGATALATGAIVPAEAHGRVANVGHHAPALDMRGAVNPAVFHAFLDRKLDVAQAWAGAVRAKVAAIPSATVLSGVERKAAHHRLAKVLAATRLLGKIPATGPYAATAAERAQVAGIKATLADTAARLKALLANEPVAVTPTQTKRLAVRSVPLTKVLGARAARWWGWNGKGWGWHDGKRDGRDGVRGDRSGRHDCDKR